MAEDSLALQYAMVAFAALVYSVKVHRPAEQVAFQYYTLAIKELQILLNDLVREKGEMAIATALQLASFDVTPPCPHFSPLFPALLQRLIVSDF